MNDALLSTALPFPKHSGKVRDVYDVTSLFGEPRLLLVATDRISAYDCILPNGIPGKGKLLTTMSSFWFEFLQTPHQVLTTDINDLPQSLAPYRESLEGRFVLAKKTNVIPFECVARGYLAGSGWAEYQATGSVCGLKLPKGLEQSDKLPAPIFTPASKAASGHDENVSFDTMGKAIDPELADTLRDLTLSLYKKAADYAAKRGILIADTKFEFGLDRDDRLLLIDEVLTPDSSRFWPAESYSPGRDQASFDKQFVRNYLSSLPWNKTPPAPPLPQEIIAGTLERYQLALSLLTG